MKFFIFAVLAFLIFAPVGWWKFAGFVALIVFFTAWVDSGGGERKRKQKPAVCKECGRVLEEK